MLNKILVIDEDVTSNLIFSKLANSVKFAKEITTYISALDALEYFKDAVKTQEDLPAAIFLDIKMPIMNGWEFLQEFNKLFPALAKQIPVYILSSSDNENDFQKARSFGNIKKYIVKPLSIKMLKELKLQLTEA